MMNPFQARGAAQPRVKEGHDYWHDGDEHHKPSLCRRIVAADKTESASAK
jgi:hypothetical protein